MFEVRARMSADFAVGFDFDHTLGIDNKLERTVALAMLDELAQAHAVSYDRAAAASEVDEMLRVARSGTRRLESFVAGFFERFVAAGRDTTDAAALFRERVIERVPDFVVALPGALEVLARLDGAGVPYAMLTNGWSPLQEEKARLIGFRGPVFVSERIGAQKPAAAAFAMLVKAFALPPERIWYVGDDPEADCAGSMAAGMHGVWYDWEQKTYPPDLSPPELVIHSLDDLFAALPCA